MTFDRIALGPKDRPAVSLHRVTNQPPMLLEQGRVVVARLTEEPRRPFDIGEQECDRAGGELRHLSCFRQNGCGLSLHSTTTGPADVAALAGRRL